MLTQYILKGALFVQLQMSPKALLGRKIPLRTLSVGTHWWVCSADMLLERSPGRIKC